jgi:hypothetical protein
MTLAFDKILKQLNSNGPQRLSGFDLSQFKGLDIDELPKVEAILETAAQNGSIIDINALGVLGTPGARAALKRILSQTKSDAEARVEALSSLLSLTRDNEYLDQLCCALKSNSSDIRRRAAVALRSADPCRRILDDFLSLIKNETDHSILSTAARGVLRYYGLIENPQDPGLGYINLTRGLVSRKKAIRSEALKEI